MGLVSLVEVDSDGGQSAPIEVGDLGGTPALSSAGHGGEHELEDGEASSSDKGTLRCLLAARVRPVRNVMK